MAPTGRKKKRRRSPKRSTYRLPPFPPFCTNSKPTLKVDPISLTHVQAGAFGSYGEEEEAEEEPETIYLPLAVWFRTNSKPTSNGNPIS